LTDFGVFVEWARGPQAPVSKDSLECQKQIAFCWWGVNLGWEDTLLNQQIVTYITWRIHITQKKHNSRDQVANQSAQVCMRM